MQATLTSKGQVTIPKAVRETLNLQMGDRLDFLLDADGTVKIIPITRSISALKGMLPRPKKPLSLEDMDTAIAQGAASIPRRRKKNS